MSQQLEGNIKFGLGPGSLTDYSDEVAKLEIFQDLQTTVKPKTFADATEQQSKSGYTQQVGITYLINEAAATRFSRFVFAAQLNDSTAAGRRPGEIYFEATMTTDAPDPDTNPTWSGWLLPSSVKVAGGTVGNYKTHDATWPARGITDPGFSS